VCCTTRVRPRCTSGKYEQARAHAEEALALARERGESQHEGWTLNVLGATVLAEGQEADALELLQQAVAVCRAGRIGGDWAERWRTPHTRSAGWAGGRGPPAVAEALRLGLEIRSQLPLWAALPAVALLEVDRGEVERATELYALAWGVPAVANSHWCEEVAGRELAAAVAGWRPRRARRP